jgi:methyl-accepting chemotaxis protein
MEQQQAEIAEINASVGDLTRIGQSNASAAEELAATMVELSQVANQTRATIDRFKLR